MRNELNYSSNNGPQTARQHVTIRDTNGNKRTEQQQEQANSSNNPVTRVSQGVPKKGYRPQNCRRQEQASNSDAVHQEQANGSNQRNNATRQITAERRDRNMGAVAARTVKSKRTAAERQSQLQDSGSQMARSQNRLQRRQDNSSTQGRGAATQAMHRQSKQNPRRRLRGRRHANHQWECRRQEQANGSNVRHQEQANSSKQARDATAR